MKLLSKKIENSQAFLTIQLESAEVEEELKKSYKRLVEEVNIPGFRKGKAPRSVLEQHIGKQGLLEDALDRLLPRACADSIQEHKIKLIAEPDIKVTQTDPVVFEATIPLPPTVNLADYHRIKMKPEPVKLKRDDVSAVIEKLRRNNATWDPVDRPLKANDIAVIDVDSSIDGKPFITEKDAHYQVSLGTPFPAPGFAEKLLKMKRDEEKEFKLKLKENYHNSELAGKEVLFKVKVIEVKEENMPELNDDFAKSIAPVIKDLDSLKKQIAKDLKNNAEEKSRMDFEEKLIDTLVEKSELEFPPIMVDAEVNHMVNQHLERLRMTSGSKEEYDKRLEVMPKEELRSKYRPIATKRVSSSLVLNQVAEAEKIEVSATEIDDEIERMTKNAGDKKEEQHKILNTPRNRESINTMLTMQKTIQRLTEIAKGTSRKNKTKKEAK